VSAIRLSAAEQPCRALFHSTRGKVADSIEDVIWLRPALFLEK